MTSISFIAYEPASWLLKCRQLNLFDIQDRPNIGFGMPIDSWLRGPLRDWSENLLDELRLRREVFFEPGPIRQKWREYLSGQRNWQYHLWNVLMFQAWLEEQSI